MPDNIRAIDCQTAVRQLWDYLDAELDDQRTNEVKKHLDTCRQCLEHADFDHRVIQALQRLRDRHPLPWAVRSQVMSVLSAAGFSSD